MLLYFECGNSPGLDITLGYPLAFVWSRREKATGPWIILEKIPVAVGLSSPAACVAATLRRKDGCVLGRRNAPVNMQACPSYGNMEPRGNGFHWASNPWTMLREVHQARIIWRLLKPA